MNMLVLHVTSGALRNLTQENNSYRLYVAAQGGLEALIKVQFVCHTCISIPWLFKVYLVLFAMNKLLQTTYFQWMFIVLTSLWLFLTDAVCLFLCLQLCRIPIEAVCIQASGALLNLALNFKIRARIGYLGGIKNLLGTSQQFCNNTVFQLWAKALGCRPPLDV